jgi:sugar phosphate isomerase/epimerase
VRFGVCAPITHIYDIYAAGFDYIELPAETFLPAEHERAFATIRSYLLASPIPSEVANCFLPAARKVVGPSVDWPAVTRYMQITLRRAAEVGVSVMVFGSGGARTAPVGFPLEQALAQFQQALHLAGDLAAEHDITIAVEPLSPRMTNVVTRVDEGAGIVELVQHPRVKLLADMFHMRQADEPFTNILAVGHHIAHIHAVLPDPLIPAAHAPSNMLAFLAVLNQGGYAGRVSLENNEGVCTNMPGLSMIKFYRDIRTRIAAGEREAMV